MLSEFLTPLYIMKFLVLALIQIRRDLVLKAGDSSASDTKLPDY